MSRDRTRLLQLGCVWCMPVGLVIYLGGMLMARALPPPEAHETARQIAERWASDNHLKQAGLVLMMFGGTLLAPFAAVISGQLRRLDERSPTLAYTQLGLGLLAVIIFVLPPCFMEAEAFRPDRDPNLILLLNDLAWLPFVGCFFFFVGQCLTVAVAGFLGDGRLFPRWLAYLSCWVALSFLPAVLIYFFKTGPFAYQGLLTYWLPFGTLGAWFVAMIVVLRAAINDEFAAGAAGAPVTLPAADDAPAPVLQREGRQPSTATP